VRDRARSAAQRGRPVAMFTTKEAVRLGLPGYAQAIESAGAPPVARLFDQFLEHGGELLLCPTCFGARGLDETHDPAAALPEGRGGRPSVRHVTGSPRCRRASPAT
jgi:hypothetical protein